MYAWYRDAAVCYVFLSDLEPGRTQADLERDLPACRWFTRGWTLQELIAPREVVFFDKDWEYRGRKSELAGLLARITGIPETVLRGEAELEEFAVARRMSWAARRETTRVEDMAYCLLGIFDVNMPLLYGEGMKAFSRLQTAILQSTVDLSVFAWLDDQVPCPPFAGMLAKSPRQFASCGGMVTVLGDSAFANFAITARGIQVDASLCQPQSAQGELPTMVLNTFCHNNGTVVGICVRKIGAGLCARSNPNQHVSLGFDINFQRQEFYFRESWVETLTLATKLPLRYPFCPSPNPVLGNRWSALRVNWGPLMVEGYQAIPKNHWDAHDGVVFGCNRGTRGWCAFFVRGRVMSESGSTKHMPVTLFLACFGVNKGPLAVVMASLNNVDSSTRIFLDSHLHQIKFESSQRAEFLVEGVFRDSFQEEVTSTDLGSVRYFKDSATEENLGVVMRIDLRKELQPDVCVNPVLFLDLSFATLRLV